MRLQGNVLDGDRSIPKKKPKTKLGAVRWFALELLEGVATFAQVAVDTGRAIRVRDEKIEFLEARLSAEVDCEADLDAALADALERLTHAEVELASVRGSIRFRDPEVERLRTAIRERDRLRDVALRHVGRACQAASEARIGCASGNAFVGVVEHVQVAKQETLDAHAVLNEDWATLLAQDALGEPT